jgi:hypothetical protein
MVAYAAFWNNEGDLGFDIVTGWTVVACTMGERTRNARSPARVHELKKERIFNRGFNL